MILIEFEIVLTHWFYLYIPWFLPFVAFALFVPALQRVEQTSEQPSDRAGRRAGRSAGLSRGRRLPPPPSASSVLHLVRDPPPGHFDGYEIVDTPTYKAYGDAIVGGQVYRDFGLEYPPGALPMFALPSLAPSDDYRPAFEALVALCGAARRWCS